MRLVLLLAALTMAGCKRSPRAHDQPPPPTAVPTPARAPNLDAAVSLDAAAATPGVQKFDLMLAIAKGVRNGDWQRVSDASDQLLPLKPEDESLVAIATEAACHLGDATRAATLFARLTPEAAAPVRETCAKLGVTLPAP